MLDFILLIAGFLLLIYGANLLVDSASSLAKRLNIPGIVIGLTIVAFGTSAPELAVNLFASAQHNSEIVLGNVIGSNIFNVLVILGISSLFYPIGVKTNTTWIEIPLSFLAALVVLMTASDSILNHDTVNQISRTEGITYLLFFIIFLVYNRQMMKTGHYEENVPVKNYSVLKSVLLIITGLAMLLAGGKLIVKNAVDIARMIGISERIISITILSIGTSLPELATSVAAARKRNVDIAIGNIVGSNIFNIFLILGLSATISPVTVPAGSFTDILVNLLAGLLLFVFIFTGKGRKIERWEGSIFLLLYLSYLIFIIVYPVY